METTEAIAYNSTNYFEDLQDRNPFLNAVILDFILFNMPMADILSLKIAAACLRERIDSFLDKFVIQQENVDTVLDVYRLFKDNPRKKFANKIRISNSKRTVVKAVKVKLGYHLRWLSLLKCTLNVGKFYTDILEMNNLEFLAVQECKMTGTFTISENFHARMKSISYVKCFDQDASHSVQFLSKIFPNAEEVQFAYFWVPGSFNKNTLPEKIVWNIKAMGLEFLSNNYNWSKNDWSNVSLPKLQSFSYRDENVAVLKMKKKLTQFIAEYSQTLKTVTLVTLAHVKGHFFNFGRLQHIYFPNLEYFASNCFYLKNSQSANLLPEECREEGKMIRDSPPTRAKYFMDSIPILYEAGDSEDETSFKGTSETDSSEEFDSSDDESGEKFLNYFLHLLGKKEPSN